MSLFLTLIFCLMLAGCNSMKDLTNTQKVLSVSNVEAYVIVGGEEKGKTPIEITLRRALSTTVELKPAASVRCKAQKLDLNRRVNRRLYLTSNTTDFAYGLSSNVSSLFYPFFADLYYTTDGRWLEFAPGEYYVDLKCTDTSPDEEDFKLHRLALKSFPMIVGNYPEYIAAVAKLSGLPEEKIIHLARQNLSPFAFVHALDNTLKRGVK